MAAVNAAMIIDLDVGGIYKFQLMPDTITDSKGANWADYNILGRSSPLKGYQNGPSRSLEFTARMFADPGPDLPPNPTGKIKADVDFLLSLPYPRYIGGMQPPPRCMVIFGGNVQMIGVCASASATYQGNRPWDLGPGLAHSAEVSLRFEEIHDTPIDTIIRRAGGF